MWSAFVLVALIATAPPLSAGPREVALGRQIAEGAVLPPEKTCAQCHGVLGIGRPQQQTPRLAGQPRFYLHKQLDDFASGARVSAKMTPVARALSPAQREAVASYYASLHAIPYPEPPYGDPSWCRRAGCCRRSATWRATSMRARSAMPMRASASCRAIPTSPGSMPTTPRSSCCCGRPASGANDALEVMAEIALRLDEREIRALALYFARVRPPPAALSSPTPEEPIPPPPAVAD